MRPRKNNGLTDEQRTQRCVGKHRWPDELSARAGAIHAIEKYGRTDKLWVYRCPHCRGWHLTRREQYGQEPAAENKEFEELA